MTEALKDNLRKKLEENQADGYAAYLAKEGTREREGYLSALSESEEAKRLASTDFGASAERLSGLGLSGSGYEDYLKGQEAARSEARELSAKHGLYADEYYNRSGYAKYLSDYEALQEKISESVIASFTEDLNFNVDDAYRIAVNSGLSEAFAEATAKSAVSKAKNAAVEKAIAYAKEKGLSALKAKTYAKNLGLDGRYLEQVYDTISYFDYERKRYYESLSAKEYLEYLRAQAKSKD